MIKLTRPLVFFDLETTGVDIYNDRIVQIGAIKIYPEGKQEEYDWLINPAMPIPSGATEIHGITDDMVADKPLLGDLAEELNDLFFNVDFGGYNVKHFDLPLLSVEFERIGLSFDTESINIVDAMSIFKINEPRTLTAAYKKYCGKDLEDAHNAMADIRASLEVFESQLEYYDDLPNTIEDISEYCFPRDPDAYDAEGKLKFIDGDLTINFGKNKGKKLEHLSMNDPGYLEWILRGTFSKKVKEAVKDVLKQ